MIQLTKTDNAGVKAVTAVTGSLEIYWDVDILVVSFIDKNGLYTTRYPETGKVYLDAITIPEPVRAAIEAAWPDQAHDILRQIRRASDHYFFNRWGMYVGVEDDGYIHT